MTLFQYLTEELKYTESEADETCLRLESGMPIPVDIKQDINKYYMSII